MKLRRFQEKFIKGALAPGIDTAALSIPRGNGKSALAAHLVERALTPDDALFRPGSEVVLAAASLEQCRIVFRFVRSALEPTGEYRFLDSNTRIGITHRATNTKLRCVGSNGKTAMGMVGVTLCVADEPGAWEVNGGQLMSDAILTALGKPESPMRAIFIGTLAPAMAGWWHDLVERGSHGSVYVQSLQADPEKWDSWPEIRRCNPLTAISPEFRKKLLEERDDARADSRLKARFLSFRLNLPSADASTMLLTVEDWKKVEERPLGEKVGAPIVGLDMGGGRAWSAAVAMWESGRVEALALAPGIPGIEQQEKRDRVPRMTYQSLIDGGSLRTAEGLEVPEPGQLLDAVIDAWGKPRIVICDRFRLSELRQSKRGLKFEPRVVRWSEAGEDIRALRKYALDGPMSCAPESRALLRASLAVATVKNDDAGNVRLVKHGANNTARDDVAAALTLAAGGLSRLPPKRTYRSLIA